MVTMLKLRSIGLSDYSVLEGRQRIGRIRLATERMPCVWIWTIQVHLIGELPMGSAKDIDTAKAEFTDGVLEVTMQAPAREPQKRQLEIKQSQEPAKAKAAAAK